MEQCFFVKVIGEYFLEDFRGSSEVIAHFKAGEDMRMAALVFNADQGQNMEFEIGKSERRFLKNKFISIFHTGHGLKSIWHEEFLRQHPGR